jgi:hypothetical protein
MTQEFFEKAHTREMRRLVDSTHADQRTQLQKELYSYFHSPTIDESYFKSYSGEPFEIGDKKLQVYMLLSENECTLTYIKASELDTVFKHVTNHERCNKGFIVVEKKSELNKQTPYDLPWGKQETLWNMRWDYLGYKDIKHSSSYTQKDWNKTFITKINQISSSIYKYCYFSANKIIVNKKIFDLLISDLDGIDIDNKIINGKYTIEIDDSLIFNSVIVKFDNFGYEPIHVFNPYNENQMGVLIHENSNKLTDELKNNPLTTVITSNILAGTIRIYNI